MANTSPIKYVTKIAAKQAPAFDVASGFNNLVSAYNEYQKTCAVEKTKRKQIKADRDVRIMALKEQASIFRLALENTFRERGDNFNRFFQLLDEGFACDNDKQIDTALTLIVEQTRAAPMMQAMQMMRDINDSSVKEIEI